jgi:hypothetical protein
MEVCMEKIRQLLREISAVNRRYDEISDITGERFNIFGILKLKSDELSHSGILAELLSPNGSHGKRGLFLELFLKTIGASPQAADFGAVETEKGIPRGRIDIFIANRTDPAKPILIENKIYAGDQPLQLLRYREVYPEAYLIYLTLDGKDAYKTSSGGKDFEYIRLSYERDILLWLELCRKEAANNPILRETLTQYILLIKDLTGLARSEEMKSEYLSTVLKDKESLSAALNIADNIGEVKRKITADFFQALGESVKKTGWELVTDDTKKKDYLQAQWGFSIKKPDGLRVEFEFRQANLKKLIYGLSHSENSGELDIEGLAQLEEYCHNSKDGWLLFRDIKEWDGDFVKLYETEEMIKLIESKVEEIDDLCRREDKTTV